MLQNHQVSLKGKKMEHTTDIINNRDNKKNKK